MVCNIRTSAPIKLAAAADSSDGTRRGSDCTGWRGCRDQLGLARRRGRRGRRGCRGSRPHRHIHGCHNTRRCSDCAGWRGWSSLELERVVGEAQSAKAKKGRYLTPQVVGQVVRVALPDRRFGLEVTVIYRQSQHDLKLERREIADGTRSPFPQLGSNFKIQIVL